jgi:HlyD family secretion protein
VERIGLRAGDRVAKGQPIATLTPAAPAFLDARTEAELRQRVGSAEAQQQRARAEVSRLEAARDQARADHARQAQLSAEGFVSPTVEEQAMLALRVAERAVEGARFALEAAGHDVAQARAALARQRDGGTTAAWEVTAPVSGAVLRVMQESEGVVGLGAPLLELADPRSLEAVVDALSQEAIAIRPGMAARVELGAGVPAVAARVRLVEPAAFTKVSALGVEEQRVNVVLDFVEPLALATIGDGYRVEAQVVIHRTEGALKVPVGAIFRHGEGWAVFVADGDVAARRAVRSSRRNGVEALIESGLAEGERVIVYPSDALEDGARIRATGGAK